MFEMGVPVSGKNLFPSNISGLPTWFIIRASDAGYQAPGDKTDIQVIMNKDSWLKDQEKVEPGTIIVYNEDVKLPVERDDCVLLGMPMTKMARGISPKLARLMANMYYVGALAHLLDIEESAIAGAVSSQFKGKEKAIEFNMRAISEGRAYAGENWDFECPLSIEARDKDPDTFLIEGNDATALGAIYGGINLLSWYPITPSSSLAESVMDWLPELRTDGNGRSTGPGISLMSEFIGLSYFSEVPGVIWDINRVGPSTGLPTRTQQGDLSMLYEASHGDTQHIVLIPGTVDECFEYGWRSFDYAERFQTLVFGFSDLDLGMNRWATSGFEYPDEAMDRGKVIRTQKEMDAIPNYGRYRDVDGDGIPYRTLPGSGLDPILYRGTGHDEDGVYSEDPQVYRDAMVRLRNKIDGAREHLPAPVIREEEKKEVGIVFYGSMENTIVEIDDLLEATGLSVSTCRVRALPVHPEVEAFIDRHETNIILEINRDGQLYGILRREIPIRLVPKLHSVAYSDGLPPRARVYAGRILETLRSVAA
jgi:2-oxoglutarate ferredoxin oxidoreductase subunit alpha